MGTKSEICSYSLAPRWKPIGAACWVANGATSTDRFNTQHYVTLHRPLRLDEYRVKLAYLPWLPDICPFRTWDRANPTASLGWYAAYNSVKHDREKRFDEATLGAALDAVCACVVMMLAQFGYEFLRSRAELSSLFYPVAFPQWEVREVYIDAGPPPDWTPTNAKF